MKWCLLATGLLHAVFFFAETFPVVVLLGFSWLIFAGF
jgi:hypothetical protein